MNTTDRELLTSLVVRLQRVLRGEEVDRISGKDSLRLVPHLETLFKSVLEITDAEIILNIDIDALNE